MRTWSTHRCRGAGRHCRLRRGSARHPRRLDRRRAPRWSTRQVTTGGGRVEQPTQATYVSRSRRKQRRLECDCTLTIDKPTSGDDEEPHQVPQQQQQRYDGWIRCNGDAPAAGTKIAETNTLLAPAADEQTLVQPRRSVAPENALVDPRTKILSVSTCFQNAQITV